MENENLAQEEYFTAYRAVIGDLNPKAADFNFQWTNLRSAVQISTLMSAEQKKALNDLLHIARTRAK